MKVYIDKELEEIFPLYLENRHREVLEMKKLIDLGDAGSLKVLAHQLAGNAGSYGLGHLSVIGARMEADCVRGDLSLMPKHLREIEAYLSELTFEYR